jgi:hypothetical protein
MITDADPTRYENKFAPALPVVPEVKVPMYSMEGRVELEGSLVHELPDNAGNRWVGERRGTPRLDDERNEWMVGL